MHSIKMMGWPAKSKLNPLFSKWIYMFQSCWGTICCQITTFSTLVVGVVRVRAALHQADCLSLEVLRSFCMYDSTEWRAPSCSTHSDWFTKSFPPERGGVCVTCHPLSHLPCSKDGANRGNNSCWMGMLCLVLLPQASCRQPQRDGWGSAVCRPPAQPSPQPPRLSLPLKPVPGWWMRPYYHTVRISGLS